MSLTAVSLKLYIALRMKFHKEEEQNLDFEFSKSLGIKLLGLQNNSAKTIRVGLKKLVELGFIDQTLFSRGGGKTNKIPNRYRFSTNWKYYKREYANDKRLKKNKEVIRGLNISLL